MVAMGAPERVPDPAAKARAARRGVGLSIRRFAKLLGVSYTTVSRWETDRRHPPSNLALALLRLVEENPYFARRVLQGAKDPATTAEARSAHACEATAPSCPRDKRLRLSLEEALARVPAGADYLTIEQFQHAVGLTSPRPIYKWIYQTRVKPERIFKREDVIAFIKNRFKPPVELATGKRRSSRHSDRRWYESAFRRKALDLIAFTGATAHLEIDRPKLHALLDELLDDLGPRTFEELVVDQACDFGIDLLEKPSRHET